MLTKEQAFDILTDTIRYNKTHQDYLRVVELAKKYKAMISGEGIDVYLKRFNLREDEELFEQRVRLTEAIVSCITGSLITPEKKIPGIKPIKDDYGYGSEKEKETKKIQLDKLVAEFYGQHGVKDYLNDHFMNLSDSDPNSFILYLFDPFDPKKEKPKVYATAISAEEAVDFQYVNNELQYLTVKNNINYLLVQDIASDDKKPKYSVGNHYNIYPGNDQIEFSQIDAKRLNENLPENVLLDENLQEVDVAGTNIDQIYYYKFDKKCLYEVTFYTPKAKRVPAFRVGNIPDISTDRRTRVNSWHRAMPYLMKSIKVCSELDLTFTLHAFPQKFEFAPPCNGVILENKQRLYCTGGTLSNGETCSSCGGSGWDTTHKSGQEVIKFALPKDPNNIFDLSKIAFYLNLPIETVKTMVEYANMIEAKAIKAVYNNDVVSQAQIQPSTATQVLTERQSIYDALSMLAQRYSYAKKFTIMQIAMYNDLEKELVVEHLFPHNMGFETVEELINKINTARTAGVNDYVLQQMNGDLVALVYVDQPEVLKQIKVKAIFNPFEGKSEGTTLALISQGLVTKYDKVLWSEFKTIFTELENDASEKNLNFYDMTYKTQKELVDKKVAEKITSIDSEKQITVDATSSFFDLPPAGKNGKETPAAATV